MIAGAGLRNAARGTVRKLMLLSGRHWARPRLTGRGTVQDLFYWVCEDGVDTVVLLSNFYSAFFPGLDTATTGRLLVYDADGQPLGEKQVSVGHLQGARFVLSDLLRELAPGRSDARFGSLVTVLDIPPAVIGALRTVEGPFYFWHRSYIGYTTSAGQFAFVHDVDTALAWKQGAPAPIRWYGAVKPRDWAPEMPVEIDDYARLHVVLLNRAKGRADVVLRVSDSLEQERRFEGSMAPNGALRFELTAGALAGLERRDLRLRVEGISTAYGRPLLFKQFRNGTISVSHS